MSTMRSGREIRAIVENARTQGGKSNTYDMLMDPDTDTINTMSKEPRMSMQSNDNEI